MKSRYSRISQSRLNVWPGFTDIMVGLLLIFIFVITLFTITQTILSRSILKKDTQLDRLKSDISQKRSEIDRLASEIAKLNELFQTETSKSQSLEKSLQDKADELKSLLSQFAEKSGELDISQQQVSALLEKLETITRESSKKDEAITKSQQELSEALSKIAGISGSLSEKDQELQDFRKKIENLNTQISSLNTIITQYTSEIDKLNSMISDSSASESAEKAKSASLQKEIKSLRSKLDDLSGKLAQKETEAKEQFRLSQLIELLDQREQEIDRLRKLAKYRSEFLAKLEEAFSGLNDIRVQGDRFVFQSEILFASGRTEINDSGKKELEKFANIYKEMVPKIPRGVNLIIMVYGHTDTDPVKATKYQSNWELSAARAMQVVRYLIEKGIPPSRLGASALGEFHPTVQENTPDSKRLNRRIEIKITTL